MIRITGVGKFFDQKKVLNDINLHIEEKEIFGIVGYSGAGKSTLLRCINGLESYEEGNVKVNEKEVKDLKGKNIREFRKNIGMIFQNFSLLNRKDVWHNVALPMEIWGYDKNTIKSKVEELLKLVGLEDKMYSMPRQLSGGQKQRVAIARALTLEPKILLCDEATSALDPNTTKSILELLKEINDKLGITIVIVTHQMEVIKEVCDRVALMENGNVNRVGRVEELFLNPDENMKKLLGEEDVLPEDGVNIKIFFPKEISENCVITSMARKLDMDFSIVWGRLEKLNNNVLGSLVINIEKEQKEGVCSYLDSEEMHWEVL